MKYLLHRIVADLHSYANIIAQILDIDVDIVDENFITLARTGIHQDCFDEDISKHAFLYRAAIEAGKGVHLFFDPRDNKACVDCPKKPDCLQTFQISAPIYLDENLIGIIGLIGVTEDQRERCQKNSDVIASFLQQTADLISSKASLAYEYDKQSNLVEMLSYINEKSNEGVIVLSDTSQIISINENGRRILGLLDKLPEENISFISTGSKILHYDEYLIKINDRDVYIAGTIFEMKIKQWKTLLVFRDPYIIKQELLNSVFKNDSMGLHNIEGESQQINALKKSILSVASSFSNILITGESGTGKELFARALHEVSKRSEHPFVALNCAAIPEPLLESELFGYVKGAFTGADPSGKIGKFELANNGTMFLDEIGDMPLFIQAKLLRVLEEREIVRLGDNKSIKIDVRIVAATHKNLKKMVRERMFREDLFYRLNVIPLEIPPLRERKGDITLLATTFLQRYAKKLDKTLLAVDPDFFSILENYSWPGNVRELQNVIEYAVNMMDERSKPSISLLRKRIAQNESGNSINDFNLNRIEQEAIEKALQKYEPLGYSREEIAQKLGIGPATLYRKMNKYGIG